VDAWEDTGERRYLDAALGLWAYIEKRIIDHEHGEWLWGINAEGRPDLSRPKGGLWKTCYHNGRACLEVIERAERAQRGKEGKHVRLR
jgi:mannobiose 2-epimerase